MGEYSWVVGLSLIVVGATKWFSDAMGIFIAGVIIFLVSVYLKSSLNNDEFTKIDRKLNILIRRKKK